MKILAIGSKNSPKRNIFSGQSTMFEGVVDYLYEKGGDVDTIDVTSFFNTKSSGKFSLIRSLEYIAIICEVLFKVCINKYTILYLTTAQSKVGFIRDYLIINIAHLSGVKVYTHQFGANYSGFYNSLTSFFKKRLVKTLNKVEKIIVEGDYTKKQFSFIEDYHDKVVAIPNGLPGKDIEVEYKNKVYDSRQPFSLIYLSNMIVSKGYLDVLKAVDLLVNVHKRNIHCVFAGKFIITSDVKQEANSSKSYFFEYLEEHNLTANVKYFDGLYGDLKEKAFKNSQVFLLPSYYINEGQPLAVLEAMAYGNVCITTNYRLIPDMVNADNGIFVDARSPESIVEKIIYLMDNPKIYNSMSKAAIAKYQSDYTFETYCSRVLDILKKY